MKFARGMMSNLEPIKVICDILAKELTLEEDQVWIYNQKWNIPSDTRVYYVVSYVGQRVIANVRKEYVEGDDLKEYQSVHSLANMTLNIFSRGSEVREAKDLALMALNSTYSQQMQEAQGFQIARNSFQVTNTSDIEGTAELYRYSISFNITYKSETTKTIGYYDTFTKEVITEA